MTDQAEALREPWDALPAQRQAATFGIWIFLVSEMLFFGAIFLAYGYVRILHPEAYEEASKHTDVFYGTLNTAILLTSSLTMVLAARAADIKVKGAVVVCLALTAAFGLAFLVVKGFEYKKDIDDGLVPGAHFDLPAAAAQIFFSFYWAVTVTHAIHLSIGIVAVARLAIDVYREKLALRSPQYEVTALYWHLVDIIWIILYPLLYLGGRSS
jgi:cytochrome c oxidase subunit III